MTTEKEARDATPGPGRLPEAQEPKEPAAATATQDERRDELATRETHSADGAPKAPVVQKTPKSVNPSVSLN